MGFEECFPEMQGVVESLFQAGFEFEQSELGRENLARETCASKVVFSEAEFEGRVGCDGLRGRPVSLTEGIPELCLLRLECRQSHLGQFGCYGAS